MKFLYVFILFQNKYIHFYIPVYIVKSIVIWKEILKLKYDLDSHKSQKLFLECHLCIPLTPWSSVLLKKLIVSSANQEIPYILWNLKGHYHVNRSPPPVPILSQMNLIHTPKLYLLCSLVEVYRNFRHHPDDGGSKHL
jgi:hypothetical protein